MIEVRKYNDTFVTIVNRYSETIEQIIIVPSIWDWCVENKIENINNSPFSHGRCLRNNSTNKYLVLLSEFVPFADKEIIMTGMSIRGSDPKDVELLTDDKLFIKHLLFHECAHAFHPDYNELECDTWAFKQLENEG